MSFPSPINNDKKKLNKNMDSTADQPILSKLFHINKNSQIITVTINKNLGEQNLKISI